MENTKENNKLIALFMGIELTKDNKGNHPLISAPFPPIECFQYHSSWNWLMPVVEKIESLKFWVENRYTYVAIGKKDHENSIISNSFSSLHNTKIEAIYKTVVQFIKWYNENLKSE